ncbi:MAG: multicopper oxidase domain-containing protein, partial [Acidobacteria bacterium]|nr:multicopper oxidase domain-containing protein [Acidobacteriota bacterium]
MGVGATAIAQALPIFRPTSAQGQTPGTQAPQPPLTSGSQTTSAPPVPRDGRYVPVRTLNGWTLPWRMNNGVKEFHLVAEEIVHEFAPGSKATCWGYNGSTPGPTIEAVEGDRVRILVTNRLGEHTTVHWHGLI